MRKLQGFVSISVDGDFVDGCGDMRWAHVSRGKAGLDITILGSGDVAAQLGAAGQVDRYQFVIIPVALGGGRTVFSAPAELRLLEQRVFRCGNVVVTYGVE